MLIERWREYFDYTEEQIQKLWEFDGFAPESRKSYYGFLHEEQDFQLLDTRVLDRPMSGMRVIDGSTQIYHNGSPVESGEAKEALLTFEEDLREQEYEFPERVRERETGDSAFLFEIGLLNIEKEYENGFETLLLTFARNYLDPHYNHNLYNYQRSLEIIDTRNSMVYVVARRPMARNLQSKGFEQVYFEGTEEPVRLSRGLYLLKMSPQELIVRFSDTSPKIPQKRGEKAITSDGADSFYVQYFQQLHDTAPDIQSDQDMAKLTYRLGRMHEDLFVNELEVTPNHYWFDLAAENMVSRRAAYNLNRYHFFFEAYYKVAYSYYRWKPEAARGEYQRVMGWYRTMLDGVSRDPVGLYQAFSEDMKRGMLISIPNSQELRMFERENAQLLQGSRWTIPFLRGWFLGMEEVDPDYREWH